MRLRMRMRMSHPILRFMDKNNLFAACHKANTTCVGEGEIAGRLRRKLIKIHNDLLSLRAGDWWRKTQDEGQPTTHDPPLCGEPDGTVGQSPKPKARGMNRIIADRIAQAQRVPGIIIISLINYMYTLPGYQYIYKSSILFLTVVVREP